ncbi:fimbria/pilus periplasmic chaperone [Citrobacter amalonaticus]|nr:fimbria/pilus periplasmic chaperone [Citrobacter amalonaticus]
MRYHYESFNYLYHSYFRWLFPGFLCSCWVVIGGTRIIYDATKKDASITVSNPDNHPYLIQTWVDNVENVTKEVPFIVTPPLYRLNAGKKA